MNKNILVLAAVLMVAACNTLESGNANQDPDAGSGADSSETDNSSTDGSESKGGSSSINHADYYVGVDGLAGAELKSVLHDIISTNVTKLTYSEVWTALQYTDEDPNNTDNVILIYTGRSTEKTDRVGQPGDDNDSWNREHMWPKSLGFPDKSQYGYTDIHHLRPSDVTVNSARGNKAFDNGGAANGEAPDTFTDSDSWEPRDEVKGDAARMMFYMDTRYDGSSGNMPDLTLVNNSSSTSGDPAMGVLCTLLEWHRADAVDEFENRRNDRIQEKQGNRNPFIDNPQWVDSIWGSRCL
ncbi:MAG: endonuclease [Reinekea sp.]|jgi:endonuclease I